MADKEDSILEINDILSGIQQTGSAYLNTTRACQYAEALWSAMQEYDINTPLRAAAFLAQLAHETGGWRWMKELGGASYFKRYDGRKDLGNTEPGDGVRFKGRGYIQITGRTNYAAAGKALNLPLLEQPELAESPTTAARIAAWWWNAHHLNELADGREFTKITQIINGGTLGIYDRYKKYETICRILKT